MTLGKSLALAMGFVVAMALGVWVGPDSDGSGPRSTVTTRPRLRPSRQAQAPKAQGVRRVTVRRDESSSRDSAPARGPPTPSCRPTEAGAEQRDEHDDCRRGLPQRGGVRDGRARGQEHRRCRSWSSSTVC